MIGESLLILGWVANWRPLETVRLVGRSSDDAPCIGGSPRPKSIYFGSEGYETSPRAGVMPYPTNSSLPLAIRRSLPEQAQDINREAFNHAFSAHAWDPRREEASHSLAWAAVKRSYVEMGNTWVPRFEASSI